MRQRWTIIISPLVCSLLALLCLVVLPFRPPGDQSVYMVLILLAMGAALALELTQGLRQHNDGLIELRSIRYERTDHPAFLVPISPHLMIAVLLISMLLAGISFDVLILTSVQCLDPDPGSIRTLSMLSVGLAVLMVAVSLLSFFRGSHGLAFLPAGVLLRTGVMECFVPWEVIQEVSLVRLPLLPGRGMLVLGMRLTNLDQVRTSRWVRRMLTHNGATHGWHCLWPLPSYTLPIRQITAILKAYQVQPEERHKIGTEKELAEVRAGLDKLFPRCGSSESRTKKEERTP